jgi:hypothetical protein
MTTNHDLGDAVSAYIARQAREEHPAGKFDGGGRWWPAAEEERACCARVRTPSRTWPYSLLVHCRTIGHVAALYGVDVAELRRAVRAARPPAPPKREGGDNYYKAVAVIDGRYLSIFDGATEYALGVTVAERPRQRHRGGIYVYRSAREARDADVPRTAALYGAPRAVLRVRAEGAYCRYDNGKIAFARVTPLEVVIASTLQGREDAA